MGKTGNQILEQIKLELEELKTRTAELEQRLTELSVREEEEQDDKPFDILLDDEISFVIPKRREELGVVTPDPEPLAEPEVEPAVEVEPVAEVEPEVEPAVEVEPVAEVEPEVEPAVEVEPVAEAESAAGEVVFEPEPVEIPQESEPEAEAPKPEKAEPKPEVKRRWQLDTPASELSNILSAIALKERGIFINALFKEDAQLFIDTIAAMNAMTSLSQAEEYIKEHFSYWKLDSDVVYRFMMAVRRKLR